MLNNNSKKTEPLEIQLTLKLEMFLKANGYTHLKETPHGIIGILPFMFTHGLVVGMDEIGYECRYCYHTLLECLGAYKDWEAKNWEGEPKGYITKK